MPARLIEIRQILREEFYALPEEGDVEGGTGGVSRHVPHFSLVKPSLDRIHLAVVGRGVLGKASHVLVERLGEGLVWRAPEEYVIQHSTSSQVQNLNCPHTAPEVSRGSRVEGGRGACVCGVGGRVEGD